MSGRGNRKRSGEVWEDLRGTELRRDKGQCPLPLVYPSHSSTYLHDKLAGIGSCHGGALPRSQDPHRPDVESGRPEVTPQHNTLERQGRKVTWDNTTNISLMSLPIPGYTPTSTKQCAGTVPGARLGSWPHSRGFQPTFCWMGPHSSSV